MLEITKLLKHAPYVAHGEKLMDPIIFVSKSDWSLKNEK